MAPFDRLNWFLEALSAGGELDARLEGALAAHLKPHTEKIREGMKGLAAKVEGFEVVTTDTLDPRRALARLRTPEGRPWTAALSLEADAPHNIVTMWCAPRPERTQPPTLTTERLTLRPLEDRDIEPSVEMETDDEVMRWIGMGGAVSREISMAGFEHQLWLAERHGLGAFTVLETATGAFLGRAYLGPLQGEIEVGYCFVKAAWGRGIATEAARAVVAWGLEDLGLERVIGITYPDNLASQRVLEKCGLAREEDKDWFERTFRYFARNAGRHAAS